MQSLTSPTRGVKRSRPRNKPARTLRMLESPVPGSPGRLRITEGKESTTYRVALIPTDFGAGFEFTKIDGPDCFKSYSVCLEVANVAKGKHLCTCPGHEPWGHKTRCC